MATHSDVVVIGAGASGLAAAKELTRLGLSSCVIEASHRIGGRAYSEEIMPGVWFDLGCAWLGTGIENPLIDIGDDLGLELGRFAADAYKPDSHRFLRDGRALNAEEWADCRRYFVACHKAIAAAARWRSTMSRSVT